MAASRRNESEKTASRFCWRRESGQATLEFALGMMMLIVLAFGVIDFGRAIYQKQVMSHLAREGSNLASRGATLTNTASQVVAASSPLNLGSSGCVIVTSVQNVGGTNQIIDQASQCAITAGSKVGVKGGNTVTVPVTVPPIPQLNQTIFVTEVFYTFQPATPIGTLLGLVMPSQLYDVAYF